MNDTIIVSRLITLSFLGCLVSVTAKAACNRTSDVIQATRTLCVETEERFEDPDPTNPKTASNPKFRPVQPVQAEELRNYEAAGLIPSPTFSNVVTQGWLVSGCIVVAPRHAIVERGHVGADLSNFEVDFKVGYQSKGQFKAIVKIKPILCGTGNIDDGLGGEDFCVFKSNHSLKGIVKSIPFVDIGYKEGTTVRETTVGFFPQAAASLDLLAKDTAGLIVDGKASFFENRTAVISGAGLTREVGPTKETALIGIQVGNFLAVNSGRLINEIVALKQARPDLFQCAP